MVDATKVSKITINTGYAGVKEYPLFTRPDGKAAQCAIILGKNGSGKSTIARALNDGAGEVEFFDEGGNSLGKDCSNVYVFDESFIIENFRVHGGDALDPVILLGGFNKNLEWIKNLEIERSVIQKQMNKMIDDTVGILLGEREDVSQWRAISVINKEIDGISVRSYVLAFFENIIRREKGGLSDLNLLCKINGGESFDEDLFCRWVALGFRKAYMAAMDPIEYRNFEVYSREVLVKKTDGFERKD